MDSNHLPVLPINKHDPVLHLHLLLQRTCYQPGPGQQHEDETFRWDDQCFKTKSDIDVQCSLLHWLTSLILLPLKY